MRYAAHGIPPGNAEIAEKWPLYRLIFGNRSSAAFTIASGYS
jgi:hypothetical protein